jgi:hypothetical protein
MRATRELARALGGEVVGGDSILMPGPGHSAGDRSLSVKFDPNAPDGFICHSHAGDDPIACRDHVRQLLGLPAWQPGARLERTFVSPRPRAQYDRADYRERTEDDLERIKWATRLWNQGVDPMHTAVEDYLRSRKLELSAELAGTVVRFHPKCPWRDENTGATIKIPVMLAAFRSVHDDVLTAVHRIRLDQGPKPERRMLGIVRHAAIKLDPIGAKLHIGEGFETAAAARVLGLKPTWAVGSVSAISFFPIIAGIKHLVILGETGTANLEAQKICAKRWQRAYRRVRVAMPTVGDDMNAALIMGNTG